VRSRRGRCSDQRGVFQRTGWRARARAPSHQRLLWRLRQPTGLGAVARLRGGKSATLRADRTSPPNTAGEMCALCGKFVTNHWRDAFREPARHRHRRRSMGAADQTRRKGFINVRCHNLALPGILLRPLAGNAKAPSSRRPRVRARTGTDSGSPLRPLQKDALEAR
jgi:hypothetical protein